MCSVITSRSCALPWRDSTRGVRCISRLIADDFDWMRIFDEKPSPLISPGKPSIQTSAARFRRIAVGAFRALKNSYPQSLRGKVLLC